MIKNVLTHIGGIEGYGIASVTLFFVFFIGMLIWAFRLNRQRLEDIGRLPLEDGTVHPQDSNPKTDIAHE
ncbi:MAG: cbb3-type cytochrome c oxidase subunit 3 [Verrucomicrobiales bacterium]|nr:cbb3-type cytochrome c oxidase subunit 3 [Verrucomicrobiales bacterium]